MQHDEWNKVELMCELLSFLSPVDLRLVGNCIEGSVRCYTNQMRPVEKTSNCAEPTASLPPFVVVQPPPVQSGNQNAIAAQRYGILNTCRRTGPMQGPPGLPPLLVGYALRIWKTFKTKKHVFFRVSAFFAFLERFLNGISALVTSSPIFFLLDSGISETEE